VERFEDLVAWQKARVLAAEVYRITGQGAFSRVLHLKGQMRDAAVSVMSNMAEGFERGRMREFHQFLSISKGSCGELRSQLYVALDATYIDESTFQRLMGQAQEVGRLVGGLRASVERKRDSLAKGGSGDHARPTSD